MKPVVFHWVIQRFTAIAMIPLSLRFLFVTLPQMGGGYAQAYAFVKTFPGFMHAFLFTTCAFYHGALGLEVIVEDYVALPQRTKILRILKGVTLVCALIGNGALFKIFFLG